MWKYRVVEFSGGSPETIEAFLNRWGILGWKLVTVVNGTYFFERTS